MYLVLLGLSSDSVWPRTWHSAYRRWKNEPGENSVKTSGMKYVLFPSSAFDYGVCVFVSVRVWLGDHADKPFRVIAVLFIWFHHIAASHLFPPPLSLCEGPPLFLFVSAWMINHRVMGSESWQGEQRGWLLWFRCVDWEKETMAGVWDITGSALLIRWRCLFCVTALSTALSFYAHLHTLYEGQVFPYARENLPEKKLNQFLGNIHTL